MNLYQTQHPFYCGIDLHANQMYACVVDQAGEKQLHRNFKTRQSDKFFADIEPFGNNLVVGCESTFNWYWLADACAQNAKSPSCSATLCTSKPSTAVKSKTTRSILKNLPTCYVEETSLPPSPTPKNSAPPATCCVDEPTWCVSDPNR